MRVSIEHQPAEIGLINRTTVYEIALKVDFTEEEKQVIEANNLNGTTVLERNPPAGEEDKNRDPRFHNLRVGDLLIPAGDRYYVYSNAQAKLYDEQLRQALSALKEHIEFSSTPPESSSFEL